MAAPQQTEADHNAQNDLAGWSDPVVVKGILEEEADTDDKGKDTYSGQPVAPQNLLPLPLYGSPGPRSLRRSGWCFGNRAFPAGDGWRGRYRLRWRDSYPLGTLQSGQAVIHQCQELCLAAHLPLECPQLLG